MTELIPYSDLLIATPSSTFTPNGLHFEGRVPFEEWVVMAGQLRFVGKVMPAVIADFFEYGEAMYGEDYAQVLDEGWGWAPQTIANYRSVFRLVKEPQRRVQELSIGHHAAVAPLSPEEQTYWLEQAVVNGWRRDDLREAIRSSKQVVEIPFVEEIPFSEEPLEEPPGEPPERTAKPPRFTHEDIEEVCDYLTDAYMCVKEERKEEGLKWIEEALTLLQSGGTG